MLPASQCIDNPVPVRQEPRFAVVVTFTRPDDPTWLYVACDDFDTRGLNQAIRVWQADGYNIDIEYLGHV